MADAMSASFWAVLNAHFFFASMGATIFADPASEISGILTSLATSTRASEFGVVVEPIMRSTLSLLINLRALAIAFVGSVASSSTIYSMDCPPASLGRSATVFCWGIPREAAGPVSGTVTAILIVLPIGAGL